MKQIYIYIEKDDEDGLQIPIIVEASNPKEAEQLACQEYSKRYENRESLQDIPNDWIFFNAHTKELVDTNIHFANDYYPKVWAEYFNK